MENDPLARKRRNFYMRTEKQVKIGKIDSAEYERLYKEQNGVCVICSLPAGKCSEVPAPETG
jgi:hypothetical protein